MSYNNNKFDDQQSKNSGYNYNILRRNNFNDENQEENVKATLDNFRNLLDNIDNKVYGGSNLITQQNQYYNSPGINKIIKDDFKYRTIETERTGLDNIK
jgi:hypothetical protein